MMISEIRFWFLILIVLFTLSLVNGQEIEVGIPDSVEFGDEFEIGVKLIDFGEDTYDVKIDIKGANERISRIWNGNDWQSTHYYVNDIIEEVGGDCDFKMKISKHFDGSASIEIKIRDSTGSYKSFSGYNINVEDKEDSEDDEELDENNEEDETEEDGSKEDEDNEDEKESSEEIEVSSEEIIEESEENVDEVIILGSNNDNQESESIKTEENIVYQSKSEIIKKYSIYAFAILCVFICILLIIKKS